MYSFYTYFFLFSASYYYILYLLKTRYAMLKFSVGAKIRKTRNNIMFNKVEFIKKKKKEKKSVLYVLNFYVLL